MSANEWHAETEIPKGSYAAGRRVRLPEEAEAPYTVFVNSIALSEGSDYVIDGRDIVFARPIVKEKVGTGRWLAMYLGFFGTYRKNETVDLEYRVAGKVTLASDLPVSE